MRGRGREKPFATPCGLVQGRASRNLGLGIIGEQEMADAEACEDVELDRIERAQRQRLLEARTPSRGSPL